MLASLLNQNIKVLWGYLPPLPISMQRRAVIELD